MQGNIPDFYADKMAQSFQETEWQRLVFVNFNGLNGFLKRDGIAPNGAFFMQS